MGVRSENRADKIINAMQAAIREAVEVAAYDISNRAKELCPVDTGTLRRSIHTEMQPSTDPNIAHSFAGSNVPYARYVEYGTRRMRAQPFMRPAFDELKIDTARTIRDFVHDAIAGATLRRRA